jgi:competence protein ComK
LNIFNDYMINEETVLFTGEFDTYGNLFTRVIEGNQSFLVRMSPEQLINKTLLRLGSSFRGALESSKEVLGPMNMYPIKVNSSLGVWLFPTKSYKCPGCVWFSLLHFKKTIAKGLGKTEVLLSFGHSIEIEMKERPFTNRVHKAEQLRGIITQNTNCPLTLFIEPKKGFRICEEAGRNKYRIV